MNIKLTKLLLQEAKQVGKLYHFTSFDNYREIKREDLLVTSWLNKFISTTRDKNFGYRVKSAAFKYTIQADVRITLDGDKLSQKYRIVPIGFFGEEAGKSLRNAKKYFNLSTLEEYKEFYDEFAPKFRIPEGKEKDKFYDSLEVLYPEHLSTLEELNVARELRDFLTYKGVDVSVNYDEDIPSYYIYFPPSRQLNIVGTAFNLLYHFDRDAKYIYGADLRTKDEMEERIIVNDGGISTVSDYILDVEFFDDDINKYVSVKGRR